MVNKYGEKMRAGAVGGGFGKFIRFGNTVTCELMFDLRNQHTKDTEYFVDFGKAVSWQNQFKFR